MKDFKLRPYQIEALNAIHEDLKTEPIVLLQAVMGAGKTVTLCRLINRYWFETDRRFLILAHKRELVQQFLECCRTMTDIPVFEIGVCCAGLGERILGKRLTIGTIQTFINMAADYPGCDLLVIDEAHRISVGTGSQYDQVIEGLKGKSPNMRLVGCTATVGRLGHGYIYGDKCRPGAKNLFPKLNHQIKYSTLLDQGYLCKLIGKISNADSLEADLGDLDTAGGDYILDQLGEVLTREIHLNTAVQAIKEHCGEYKMISVFCCTIDHAEKLKDLIGEECVTIHSQLSPLEREINMESWLSGRKRICTSINILSEGVDIPALQCLVMARPTLSSTLFLQSVGRVLRLHPSKNHGFLLDLSGNTARFGTDLDNVKIGIPKAVEKKILKDDPLCKLCPSCERECFISLRICPHCGFEWPVEEIVEANRVPDLKDVIFAKSAPKVKEPPVWYDVLSMSVEMHQSRKNEKYLGRIVFGYGNPNYPSEVSLWLCFSDFYQGFAVDKARQTWERLFEYYPFPNCVEELIELRDSLVAPIKILLDQSDRYPEIVDYLFNDTPFDLLEEETEMDKIAFGDDDIPF